MAGQLVSKSPLMISVSGIRGVVGESMTVDLALRWANAFGRLAAPGPVIIGGDSRVSRSMMRAATIAGLTASGCSVIDLQVVPTPTVQIAIEHHHAKGGIAITASHNPAQWNALKFFNAEALFLDEAEGSKVRRVVESGDLVTVSYDKIGSYSKDDDVIQRHIDAVLAIPFLSRDSIKKRRYRVALDAVNGAGGVLLNAVLESLGCEVVPFHLEPTGLFPRNPEPIAENLRILGTAMAATQIDIGFVLDPDADRLAVILENGEPAGEELTLAAAVDVVLHHMKGNVVVNCSTSLVTKLVAASHGSAVLETKVGEAHVSRGMKMHNAVIGGEGNGGVMFPAVHIARDSAVGAALILQALVESGLTATEYFGSLPKFHLIKKKLEFSDLSVLSDALKSTATKSPWGKPDVLDGLKWRLERAWVQIRASNTEPIARVFAEAASVEEAQSLSEQAMKLLQAEA